MVILGIDEVGRGCLAGPMVVGAVILNEPISGLKDSKLLTKSQRCRLDEVIRHSAAFVGLGWSSPREIDELGLTEALRLAVGRSIAELGDEAYDQLVIDGNYNFLPENPKAVAVIKADNTVSAVSAASIVAKVARDNYMSEIGAQYPDYAFDKHVGYGTALHLEKLAQHGICDLHRRSFKPVKDMLAQLV